MHLSQLTMPHDLHVYLKKTSTHHHLHLKWFFASAEGASSNPFTLSGALDLHYLLKCPSFPHFQHTTFIGFPGDLDLPLDDLFLFLFWDHPRTNKASPFWLSIFFRLISSVSKAETISSNCKAVALLPIAITRLSHESGREHNKLMHLSSSEILISTDNN